MEKSWFPEIFSSPWQPCVVWGLYEPKSPKTTSSRVIIRFSIYSQSTLEIQNFFFVFGQHLRSPWTWRGSLWRFFPMMPPIRQLTMWWLRGSIYQIRKCNRFATLFAPTWLVGRRGIGVHIIHGWVTGFTLGHPHCFPQVIQKSCLGSIWSTFWKFGSSQSK